jgi:hypothetical protein
MSIYNHKYKTIVISETKILRKNCIRIIRREGREYSRPDNTSTKELTRELNDRNFDSGDFVRQDFTLVLAARGRARENGAGFEVFLC